MKLVFLGTRGEIDLRSSLHGRHTSLLVAYKRQKIMVDCGNDWLDLLYEVKPHAIVLTHAHPDHAWGLKRGATCPVYATEATWNIIRDYPIAKRMLIKPRRKIKVRGISFEAFPVEHSTRCPAVAYRITAGLASIVYAPDVAYFEHRSEALFGANCYIGDGASLTRPMIRRRGERLMGHAAVQTQLTWCQRESVSEAIITHCGSQIVADHEKAQQAIDRMGAGRGVRARLAFDGMTVQLR